VDSDFQWPLVLTFQGRNQSAGEAGISLQGLCKRSVCNNFHLGWHFENWARDLLSWELSLK